ncbi:MAG: radical SAM protein [Deltaproteobacteria bacterium]|nr:radical SAM protein [Deltaproteobacteria bacterium]
MADDIGSSRRRALHDRYMEVSKLGDASRLAYLRGPESSWTLEQVAALWKRALARPVSAMEPLNCVYLHVPFCKSICDFCNYDRLRPSSPALLKNWVARVTHALEILGPAVRPLTFHALYIGGGTPSVLPAKMLREVLEALERHLLWDPRASRRLEFDPAVMNRERMEVLATYGFRQLSFGIETLDPEINARHNRGRQGIEMIERSFDDLKAVGIGNIACDFLLGLEGTTPTGMIAEIETVLTRFRPAWVDIFMLTPTRAYVESHFGGSIEAFWRHMKAFEAVVPAALPDVAARTGYVVRVGSGHHMMLMRGDAMPDDAWGGTPETQPQYSYTALTSEARRPLNLLGLGRSARSVLFGTAAITARDPHDDPAVAGPGDYVGHAIDVADEARSFLVHLLRDKDTVDRDEFRHIFGADMTEVIPEALAGWAEEGTARLEDDVLRFVPQERLARVRTLLWLVPEENIEFDLAHFDQLDLSPRGVEALSASIAPGAALAGEYTLDGVDGGRLLLRRPGGRTLRMRIAPPLTERGPLRLVLETPPDGEDVEALRRAVNRLRTFLTDRHHRAAGHGKHRDANG